MSPSNKHWPWIGLVLAALVIYYVTSNEVGQPTSESESPGTVTISWLAPTENEDDSPIVELAGFAIHYTKKDGQDPVTIYVNDPAVTSYTIENLEPGKYFFSISAIEADGDKSDWSNVVAKTVR